MNPILIVKVGDTHPGIAASLGDFEDWVRAGLGPTPAPVVVVDPRGGAPLPSPDRIAGAVVTGSHSMVTDREPWNASLAAWLAAMVGREVPLLAICYGHQALADALGGEVGDLPGGVEVGTVEVARTPEADDDPLLGSLPEAFPAQAAHRQGVRRLPPGAVLLARTSREPHAAFRVGRCAWGVQFHPEFSPEAASGYVRAVAGRPHSGIDARALLAPVAPTPTASSVLATFARLATGGRGGVVPP
jgi:GMP synthase (glutamine-hydrolysing)